MTYEGMISDLVKLREHSMMPEVFKPTLNAILEYFAYEAIPKTKWIPVTERLPSAEDCPMDCMVTRRSKYVGNYTDMAVAEGNGTWTHEDWKAITIKGEATCISTKDADIIAWMPLPEPFREDGDTE